MSKFNKIDKAMPQEVDRSEYLLKAYPRLGKDEDDYFDTMPIEHLRNEAKFWRREAFRLADKGCT